MEIMVVDISNVPKYFLIAQLQLQLVAFSLQYCNGMFIVIV